MKSQMVMSFEKEKITKLFKLFEGLLTKDVQQLAKSIYIDFIHLLLQYF